MTELKKRTIRMGDEYDFVETRCKRINKALRLVGSRKWNRNAFIREVVLRFGGKLEEEIKKTKEWK